MNDKNSKGKIQKSKLQFKNQKSKIKGQKYNSKIKINKMNNNYPLIRKIYLYLFALIGLGLITIGCVMLVGLGLKTYVFTKADIYYEYPMIKPTKTMPTGEGKMEEFQQPSKEEIEEYQNKQQTSSRQREAAESLASIIVGLPLYLYHWHVIKKDKKEENA